jgi:hypothetical protein
MEQLMSQVSRTMWELLEPIHAVTYFTPDAAAATEAAGYRGFWMAYFACRLAPLGAVGPEVGTAVCFGFAPGRVARALPDAWTFAGPEQALAARLDGATTALRNVLGEVGDLDELADLLWTASQYCDGEGRALAAANLALPRPTDPLGVIWQAATTLREHRGDGHNAALVAFAVTPVEAHWLKIAAQETAAAALQTSRNWPEPDWEQGRVDLQQRGWLDNAGELTDEGRLAHNDIEARTDVAASAPWRRLGEEQTARLMRLVTPLTNSVLNAVSFPFPNPIGLNRPQ